MSGVDLSAADVMSGVYRSVLAADVTSGVYRSVLAADVVSGVDLCGQLISHLVLLCVGS